MSYVLNKIRYFIIFFVGLMVAPIKTEYPAVDLRGTYSVLKPEYKHLSPLNGFVWYNRGITKSYYRYGDSSDATIQLIEQLFNIIEEHNEFNVTNRRTNVVRYFTPTTIGKMLVILEQEDFKAASNEQKTQLLVSALSSDLSSFKGVLNTKEYEKIKKSELEKLKLAIAPGVKREKYTTFLTTTPQGQKILEDKPYKDDIRPVEIQDQPAQKGAAAIPADEIEKWFVKLGKKEKLAILAQTNKAAAQILGNSGNVFIERQLTYFVQLVVNALQEQVQGKYHVFTVQNILLSYLNGKADDRNSLKLYFDQLPNDFFIEGKVFELDAEKFSRQTYLESKEKRNDWLDIKNDFSTVLHDDEQYEKVVFGGLKGSTYEMRFAKISNYAGQSEYEFSKNKSGVFANCVETTIRNIINIIIKKPENLEFDLSLLEQSGMSVKEHTQEESTLLTLKDFYNKFKTIESIDLESAHNEWNKVVSDIPGVGYVFGPNGVRSGLTYHNPERDDNMGFFELKSSIPHFITIFRYLFNMPAFESYLVEDNIVINQNSIVKAGKEIDSEDVKKIIVKLFEQFSREDLVFDIDNFDLKENIYGTINFTVFDTVNKKKYAFNWTITEGHSQIDSVDDSYSEINLWRKDVSKLLSNQIENFTPEKDRSEGELLNKYLILESVFSSSNNFIILLNRLKERGLLAPQFEPILFYLPITRENDLQDLQITQVINLVKGLSAEWVKKYGLWILDFVLTPQVTGNDLEDISQDLVQLDQDFINRNQKKYVALIGKLAERQMNFKIVFEVVNNYLGDDFVSKNIDEFLEVANNLLVIFKSMNALDFINLIIESAGEITIRENSSKFGSLLKNSVYDSYFFQSIYKKLVEKDSEILQEILPIVLSVIVEWAYYNDLYESKELFNEMIRLTTLEVLNRHARKIFAAIDKIISFNELERSVMRDVGFMVREILQHKLQFLFDNAEKTLQLIEKISQLDESMAADLFLDILEQASQEWKMENLPKIFEITKNLVPNNEPKVEYIIAVLFTGLSSENQSLVYDAGYNNPEYSEEFRDIVDRGYQTAE